MLAIAKLAASQTVKRNALARSTGLLALAAGAGLFAMAPAGAQTPVGGTTLILNEVLGHTGGGITKLRLGDTVFRDQLVQTAMQSRAKIVFLDTTNMSVGPDSIVRLDEFVYNGNGTASRVTINATKGAFRFFSGNSPSGAYQVRTPQAVIGVRGTTYDVRVANGQTYIKLQEGAVTACTASRNQCRDLDRPGESLIVTENAIEGPFPANSSRWDFGDLCAGAASDLCRKTTRFAQNNAPPPPPAFSPPPPRQTGFRPPPPPPLRVVGLPPPVYAAPGARDRSAAAAGSPAAPALRIWSWRSLWPWLWPHRASAASADALWLRFAFAWLRAGHRQARPPRQA
jgi:hypothetical protein